MIILWLKWLEMAIQICDLQILIKNDVVSWLEAITKFFNVLLSEFMAIDLVAIFEEDLIIINYFVILKLVIDCLIMPIHFE